MTCYQRHLGSLFEALGLEYDKTNRTRVDAAIRGVLGLGGEVTCPAVWAAIKALSPEDREGLAARVAGALGAGSVKSVADKAHIKAGTTIAVLNEVPGIVGSLGLPNDVTFTEPADARLVFLFVSDRAQLETDMPSAVAQLAPGAALWVFYRKGSKSAGLDMSRDSVWAIAEGLGMRPLGLVGVDDTWSAFRLRAAG